MTISAFSSYNFMFMFVVSDGPEIIPEVSGATTNCAPNSLDQDCTTTLGVDVTITCRVSANPPATLKVIVVEESSTQVISDGSTEAEITVDNLALDHLGIYQCIANNTVVGNEAQTIINIGLSLFGMCMTVYLCVKFSLCRVPYKFNVMLLWWAKNCHLVKSTSFFSLMLFNLCKIRSM